MMYRSIGPLVALFLISVDVTSSFTPARGAVSKKTTVSGGARKNLSQLMAQDDEPQTFVAETSFGAEAVPEGQRPVNEYLELTRSPLFDWPSEEVGTKGFLTRIVALYAVVYFTVCFPISGATYTQDGYLLQKIAASAVGASGLLVVLMVRLYSGWGYVSTRLQSKFIEYEESGWYDGDIEEKTEEEKRRDKFLFLSDVKPVMDRLKLFSIGIGGSFVASVIFLNVASSMKPVFDEYDPKMLEQLRYNDKIADVAAEQSGGRPTYCDNRYYRAVANGGQGCN